MEQALCEMDTLKFNGMHCYMINHLIYTRYKRLWFSEIVNKLFEGREPMGSNKCPPTSPPLLQGHQCKLSSIVTVHYTDLYKICLESCQLLLARFCVLR